MAITEFANSTWGYNWCANGKVTDGAGDVEYERVESIEASGGSIRVVGSTGTIIEGEYNCRSGSGGTGYVEGDVIESCGEGCDNFFSMRSNDAIDGSMGASGMW